jgi:rubrerythrin
VEKKEVMNSEGLTETLEILKAISDLELALAGFYQFCSGFREGEKDFWLELEQDEQKHARTVQKMAQMLADGQSLVVSNTSFNVSPVHSLRNFIAKSMKRLETYQIPSDFKNLLSIAWNMEYSISEMKYGDIFSIAEQEYETLMQTIVSETAAHRTKLGSKISALRNYSAKARNRLVPRVEKEAPRKITSGGSSVKVRKAIHPGDIKPHRS